MLDARVRFMFLHSRVKRVMPITRRGIKRGKEQRGAPHCLFGEIVIALCRLSLTQFVCFIQISTHCAQFAA